MCMYVISSSALQAHETIRGRQRYAGYPAQQAALLLLEGQGAQIIREGDLKAADKVRKHADALGECEALSDTVARAGGEGEEGISWPSIRVRVDKSFRFELACVASPVHRVRV